MMTNFYKVLRISPVADIATIRTAYRRAALAAHPDKGGSKELFHLVTVAFETLANKRSRDAYDRLHGLTPPQYRPKKIIRTQRERQPKHGRARYGIGRRGAFCKTALARRKQKALDRLRHTLQSIPACQRAAAIGNMDSCVRKALFQHMNEHGPVLGNGEKKKDASIKENRVQIPKSGAAGVHQFGQLRRAFVAVANLEVYSRLHSNIEGAIEDRVVLSRVRDVIMSAMNAKRSDNHVIDMVRQCLAEYNTSEDEIQLRAKIRVRATEWMGALRIGSPMLSFENAIRLRSKLLHARRSSWEHFRAECVSLLQRVKHVRGRAFKRTLNEAENVTDEAWASAELKRKTMDSRRSSLLWRLVDCVKTILDSEADRANKATTRMRRSMERKAKMAMRQTQDELRRWHRRSDLTIEEIIRGPPTHLRKQHVQKSCI